MPPTPALATDLRPGLDVLGCVERLQSVIEEAITGERDRGHALGLAWIQCRVISARLSALADRQRTPSPN